MSAKLHLYLPKKSVDPVVLDDMIHWLRPTGDQNSDSGNRPPNQKSSIIYVQQLKLLI